MIRILITMLLTGYVAYGQVTPSLIRSSIEFKSVSKIKTNNTGRAHSYDGSRIIISGVSFNNVFIYEYETYYIYDIAKNTWGSVNFPSSAIKKSARSRPGNMSTFLPGQKQIVTMGDPIEILDTETMRLSVVGIEGTFPWSTGNAVYKDKIYYFGGAWITEDVPASQFIRQQQLMAGFTDQCFVFDDFKFTEIAPLPDKRRVLGKFIGDKLYALGGGSLNKEFNDILMYDPDKNTWSTVGYLPHAVCQNAITDDGSLIYVTGYNGNTGYLGIYDPASNHYREYITNLNLKNGTLVYHQNQIYYFSGHYFDDIRNIDRRIYLFDLATLPPAKEFNCSGN